VTRLLIAGFFCSVKILLAYYYLYDDEIYYYYCLLMNGFTLHFLGCVFFVFFFVLTDCVCVSVLCCDVLYTTIT
jgi:hypothetical protein